MSNEMQTDSKPISHKERFEELCRKHIHRDGIDELMEWLDTHGFYTSPASSRYHGAHEGGLVEHSLNVYDEIVRLLSVYPEIEVPTESVVISSLFHDLCKVEMYIVEKRNRKNAFGQWESYDSYTIDEKFSYGGHGSKSVYLIQHFIKLTPLEAVAINCHMSSWEDGSGKYVGKSYEQFPFAWLLHVADEAATFVLEGTTS